MTHAPGEGFDMITAAQKNARIVQVGSQRVSSVIFGKAKELIDSGAIGEVYTVESMMGRNEPGGAWVYPYPQDLSPQTLDWDTWLGTAPKVPFNPLHYVRWRCWQAYGSGVAGDLMVHLLSGIHFAGEINQPPQRALATGGLFHFRDGRDVPDVHCVLYDYPKFPVLIRLTLACDTPEVTRFLGTRGALEIRSTELTFTSQDGTAHSPGWNVRSFPKTLREEYEKQWHIENDARLAKLSDETITYRSTAGYDDGKPHLRNFFDAVRTRKPVVEDAVFGNNTAIACHMANASYFKKNIAVWDGASKSVRV